MNTILILLGGSVIVVGILYIILFSQWNRD